MENSTSKIKEYAIEYNKKGWEFVPLENGTKLLHIKGWTTRKFTLDDLKEPCNIGIKLGKPSGGLVDIDLDWDYACKVAPYFLPDTGTRFGRGGKCTHWLYYSDGIDEYCKENNIPHHINDPIEENNDKARIIELRSTGHQVMAPPSIHPETGEELEWFKFGEPFPVPPEILCDAYKKIAAASLISRYWRKNDRQDTAMALVGGLVRWGWGDKEISNFLDAILVATGDEEPSKRVYLINRTINRAREDKPNRGWTKLKEILPPEVVDKVINLLHPPEKGRAVIANPFEGKTVIIPSFYPRPFSKEIMSKFVFHFPGGRDELYYYDPDEGIWRDNGEDFVRNYLRGKTEMLTDEKKKNYYIEEIVSDVKQLSWKGEQLPEPSLELIPFENGVYDINKDTFSPYTPEFYFTWKLPWKFNHKAVSKTLTRIISQLVPEERVIDLYELMAYILYRSYIYPKMFFIYGRGSNGKSTFENIIVNLVGHKQASFVSLEELQNNRFAGSNLWRKLVNISGEVEYQEIQNTKLIKQITGEDPIEADRKYRNTVKFYNYAKMIFITNDIPRTRDTTNAFYRRVFLIEFPYTFQENPHIRLLTGAHTPLPDEEYEGLLQKVLQVMRELRDRNWIFTNHPKTEEVREKYEILSSPLTQFIQAKCDITRDGKDFIFKWEFNEKFSQYMREIGRVEYSERRLKEEMTKLGLEERQVGEKRWRAWVGIRWKTPLFSNLNREEGGENP